MNSSALCLIAIFVAMAICGQTNAKESWRDSRFDKQWPSADDVAWFEQAKGMTQKEVSQIYGTPVKVETMKNGRVRWTYPWLASSFIDFDRGIGVIVFYTAGY